jgi:DNA-binding IclR family transcriptional regulator
VPLVDAQGQTLCALNVSTRSDRISLQTAKTTVVPLLRETAASIRSELEAV